MFSYMGNSEYILNEELREGSLLSNSLGMVEYFTEALKLAMTITEFTL